MSFSFGGKATLREVSLGLSAGSFFALLGASGSGKTTLLKLIGGYLTPGEGRVVLSGRDITGLPPERRHVGMVFQSYALFPHLTARGNVAFGLEVRGVSREDRQRRVEEVLDRVGLASDARDRKPAGLSGGQQQRVALARALVIEPDLLLLDEPLANLDRRLKDQVRGELRHLQRRTGVTTLLVTHDPEEALALADRLGVMAGGRLLQVGSPAEVYERPCCPYVARLLGDANLLRVEQAGPDGVTLTGGMRVAADATLRQAVAGDTVLLRPGAIRLGPEGEGQAWTARVSEVSYRGGHSSVEVLVGGTRLLATAPMHLRPEGGQDVTVWVAPQAWWLVPQQDPPGLLA